MFFFPPNSFSIFYIQSPLPSFCSPWRCDAVIQLLTKMFSHIAEYAFRAFAIAKPCPGQTRERRHQTYVFTVCQKSKNKQKNSGAPVWHGPIFAPLFRHPLRSNRSVTVVFRQMGSDSGMKNERIIIMSSLKFLATFNFHGQKACYVCCREGTGGRVAVGPLPKNKNNMMTKSVEFNRSQTGSRAK